MILETDILSSFYDVLTENKGKAVKH